MLAAQQAHDADRWIWLNGVQVRTALSTAPWFTGTNMPTLFEQAFNMFWRDPEGRRARPLAMAMMEGDAGGPARSVRRSGSRPSRGGGR